MLNRSARARLERVVLPTRANAATVVPHIHERGELRGRGDAFTERGGQQWLLVVRGRGNLRHPPRKKHGERLPDRGSEQESVRHGAVKKPYYADPHGRADVLAIASADILAIASDTPYGRYLHMRQSLHRRPGWLQWLPLL
jgi:hypothetical protein